MKKKYSKIKILHHHLLFRLRTKKNRKQNKQKIPITSNVLLKILNEASTFLKYNQRFPVRVRPFKPTARDFKCQCATINFNFLTK